MVSYTEGENMGYYASYYKCALQVNPYSYTKYRGNETQDEEEYNHNILAKCQENNIKIIGLADHGTVDTSESLRKVLVDNDIIVFPGFEIASAEKIHMVCLFPTEKTNSELNRILGSMGLPAKAEKETDPSTKSCIEIAKIIEEAEGFWYAAHITGDNGILKIGQMQQVWKNELFVAAQIPASKEEIDPKYNNIIRNKDQQYKREHMVALINAKDIEKPSDLDQNSATTLIKMTTPSFDNFVTAFRDPESRIRLNSEIENSYQSSITRMVVQGGYLDGLEIEFSDNLTTLIGGRGTGKSTIINLIRYTLDIVIDNRNEQRLFEEMIQANLGSTGKVEIDIVSNKYYGQKFKIIRRYKQNPVIEDENGNVVDLKAVDLLPVVEIYGQNEIMESVGKQDRIEKIVKRLFKADIPLNEKIESAYKKLRENGDQLTETESRIEDNNDTVSDLPATKERLKYFEEAGIDKKLTVITKLSKEEAQFENYKKKLPSSKLSINTIEIAEIDNEILSEYGMAVQSYNKTVEQLKGIYEATVEKLHKVYDEKLNEWNIRRQEYDSEVKTALKGIQDIQDKSSSEIVEEYTRLVKTVNLADPIKKQMELLEKQKQDLLDERKKLVESCRKCWDESDVDIQKQVKKLNKNKLKGKVMLSIYCRQQKDELLNILTKIDRVTDKALKGLIDYQDFDIFTFVDDVRQGIDELCSKYSMTTSIAEKIVTGLKEQELRELEQIRLKNIYLIELEVDGKFKPIDKLSKGQQCTAILNILLLDNKDPLIIDQPEDNLDNSFIAENLVELIRENKIKRQYIFATHNANIPVFGDAELIIAMEEADGKGLISEKGIGSIDACEVKNKVVKILEGGADAFQMRKRKYNIV